MDKIKIFLMTLLIRTIGKVIKNILILSISSPI